MFAPVSLRAPADEGGEFGAQVLEDVLEVVVDVLVLVLVDATVVVPELAGRHCE